MKKIYLIIALQFLIATIQAQEDKKNFCLNCTRDLSDTINGIKIDSIDILIARRLAATVLPSLNLMFNISKIPARGFP